MSFFTKSFFQLSCVALCVFTVGVTTQFAQANSCKPFQFNLAPSYQIGTNPSPYISADFNVDGKTDIATVNRNAPTISVLFGDGGGGFGPRFGFDTVINPQILASGDLNNDGKADIIVASSGVNKLAILINDGNGGFLAPTIYIPPTQFPNQSEYFDLKTGDFNGDGNLDVAATQYQSGRQLRIFLGNGTGSLTLTTTLNLTGNQGTMTVGRINGDNFDDIIVSRQISGSTDVVFVPGNAGGNFAFGSIFSVPNAVPASISISDLNNDGYNDLTINSTTGSAASIRPYLGNGNGTFSAAPHIDLPEGLAASEIKTADFNGDGKIDIAATLVSGLHSGIIVMSVYGVGDGTFQNQILWYVPEGTTTLLAADVNSDGKPDIVAGQTRFSTNNVASVLINDGTGGFNAPRAQSLGGDIFASGDFSGDHYQDIIRASSTVFHQPALFAITRNDPTIGFTTDDSYSAGGGLKSFTTGDFNGDGKIDLVTVHEDNVGQIKTLLGNGLGAVGDPIITSITTGIFISITGVIAGDFNADGKDDIYVVASNGNAYSYLGTASGAFTLAPNFPVQNGGKLLKGDFNSDGKIDLVVGNGLWLGDGTGQFTLSPISISGLSDMVTGDFNGDGKLDLAGFANGGVRCLPGDGTGNFGTPFALTTTGTGTFPISGDFNGDGSDDIAFLETNIRGNLEIVPSGGSSNMWNAPILLSIGAADIMIASDFNGDGKPDIGIATTYYSRSVIYNTSGGTTPCMSINDVSVTETDVGSINAAFTVSLSTASTQPVSVNYTVTGGTATIGTDFQNVLGRLVIPAGQTSGMITVTVLGDTLDEFDETFNVILASPSNAVITKDTGLGTIVDNDAPPTLNVGDVSLNESSVGQLFTFSVVLSSASAKPITFRATTADGTAVSGSDYTPISTVFTINPGSSSINVSVTVPGDTMYEPNEEFFLNITEPTNVTISDGQGKATIINDDPIPILSIGFGGSVVEGDVGILNKNVTIQFSNPTYLPVTLNLATSPGTATANVDYVSSDVQLTIPPAQTSYTTTVAIIGDTVREPSETFFVNMYNITNAVSPFPQGTVSITDDDATVGDYDLDGKADISVFRPSEGVWYQQRSQLGFRSSKFGLPSDILVPADYTGDGRTDIAVWRPSDGTWYGLRSENSTLFTVSFGMNGDIPAPGDYDGDGKADNVVYRPTQGTWYLQRSTAGFLAVQFGIAEDKPALGDYDGDGKNDISVYRPSTGYWYRLNSSNGTFTGVPFGFAGDKIVQADYTGDGKTDIAVWRPSTGVWYVFRSEDNWFYSNQFGLSSDLPVPGDYDGDGKVDIAVYRPSEGNWYMMQSTSGFNSLHFGTAEDKPTGNAYIF